MKLAWLTYYDREEAFFRKSCFEADVENVKDLLELPWQSFQIY